MKIQNKLASPFAEMSSPQKSEATAAGNPDSSQFNTQLLVALLNTQQGQAEGAPLPPGSIASGQSGLQLTAPSIIGRTAGMTVGIASSAGALDQAAIQGQDAAALASNMIDMFGSQGALSVSDVERALGCDSSTADPQAIAKIKNGIESDWNAMTGGDAMLSRSQLASAIQKYLLSR